MAQEQKLYLIRSVDINTTPDRPSQVAPHRDDIIMVLDKPGRTNLSNEERVEGWLGTTDNRDRTALGEFTKAEALAYLRAQGINAPDIRVGQDFSLSNLDWNKWFYKW